MRKIASGNTADIYLDDGKIVKVYFREPVDAVESEARNQAYAKSLGLPVPGVIEHTERDGKQVLVMEHIAGETMLARIERDPSSVGKHLAHSVEIQRSIHAVAAPELRPMSDRLAQQILSVDQIDESRKQELLGMLDGVGAETQLCHGDSHVMNVILGEGGPVIIDWMDATRGDVRLDVCRTYLLYGTVSDDIAEMYLEEFCRQSGFTREEVLQWLPVMAVARLSEGVDANEGARLLAITQA